MCNFFTFIFLIFYLLINSANGLNKVIAILENRLSGEPKLSLIISRLKRTRELLLDNNQNKTLKSIYGITRAYLDITSDYADPIVTDLHTIEKEIDALSK